MTQEQKDLLLKDLCTRLPYGVIAETSTGKGHVCDINLTIFGTKVGVNINPTIRDTFDIENIRLYLFPFSSMTKEQNLEFLSTCRGGNAYCPTFKTFDWCDKNHFDYRGLIPMGLAIDATELNIY